MLHESSQNIKDNLNLYSSNLLYVISIVYVREKCLENSVCICIYTYAVGLCRVQAGV